MDLGDPVDGGRPHDGEIWGVLARSRGPKGTNGAGAKHAEIVDPGCSAKEKRERNPSGSMTPLSYSKRPDPHQAP